VTFCLSAAQPADVIPGTGRDRAHGNEPGRHLHDRRRPDGATNLLAALTRGSDAAAEAAWLTHDLRQLDLPGQRISMFPNPPTVGGAFLLGFGRDRRSTSWR
jgi:hypothetical protein